MLISFRISRQSNSVSHFKVLFHISSLFLMFLLSYVYLFLLFQVFGLISRVVMGFHLVTTCLFGRFFQRVVKGKKVRPTPVAKRGELLRFPRQIQVSHTIRLIYRHVWRRRQSSVVGIVFEKRASISVIHQGLKQHS